MGAFFTAYGAPTVANTRCDNSIRIASPFFPFWYTLYSFPDFGMLLLWHREVPLLSSKLPWLALGGATLLALLLFLNLEFVSSSAKSLLLSSSLDLVMVLLAATCCFYAARRSSGWARQIWALLGAAFALETLAQATSAYYQNFAPVTSEIPWPSDILFFVWAAPVFMIFLPQSDKDARGVDWVRLLDCLQVAIVAVTVYLYFFYSPSRWRGNPSTLLRQILILYVARDLILSVGFFFRSRSSLPSWLRSFSLVLAMVFLAAVLSDADYLFTLGASAGKSSWGDLVWMLPSVIVIGFAAIWKQPNSVATSAPSTRLTDFLAAQFFPIAMPLVVIFMARAVAREQFPLAWVAVTTSVVCSSVRLSLSNRRQRRVANHLLSTEQALRRSEQMLSTAFRSSPDAFSINKFPDGHYIEVNDGFTRLTGYTREETLQKTPREMNLWKDPAERENILSRLGEETEIRNIEFCFRTKDGRLRSGQMSASLMEIHRELCSLVVVRDITDRKEAEDIIRTSEERFRSLVQNLHVGILTFDPEARVLFANHAALDLLDFGLDQVIGRTISELGMVAFKEDGADITAEFHPVSTVILTREPFHNLLVRWRIPDHTEVLWTLLDAVPEFTAGGELFRVVLSLTNLTEQRRALQALRESEERFRTLVRDLHVAVVLVRPEGHIEFANAAAYRMFALPEGCATGKTPADFGIEYVTADQQEVSRDDGPAEVVLRTGAAIENGILGVRFRSVPDKIIWIFGNAVPQLDAQGKVIRVIHSFADITEMKNAERSIHQLSTQLLKLQDEERRHLGRELHDGLAQTVLAVNLSLAQARQSIQPGEQLASRALEKARSLTQQMSREIRTLSYLLHPPLLDDLGLVAALKEYAQGFSERSGIDTQLLVLTPFERLPQTIELALFRVVQESLANIQRHSGSTTAQIRLGRQASAVALELVDFGHGMKLPSNGSPGEARLGVGIAGMRERMAQLRGRLEIISGPQGTTVRATLPVKDVPTAEAQP